MNKTYTAPFILVVIMQIVTMGLYFFIPLQLEKIGLTGFEIGVLFAISAITAFLSVFEIGTLTDRIPIKLIISASILCMSTYLLGLGITTSFTVLSIMFLVGGLGTTAFKESMESFVLKHADTHRGEKFGTYELVKMIASGLAMVASGYLIFIFDFNMIFIGAAILILASLVVTPAIEKNKITKTKTKDYFKDITNTKVIGFLILIFLFTLHWGAESTSYGLFLNHNLGLSTTQMGIFFGISIIFLGFSALFFGKRYDKKNNSRELLLYAFFLSGISFILFAITTNTYISLFFRMVHEIGDGAFIIFMFTGIKRFFTNHRIGGDLGLITIITIIGKMLGALLFGPMGDLYGYQWPHIVAGSIIVVSGLFILTYKRHAPLDKSAQLF